ncbi:hypothetical protein ADT71_24330 [Novosphingobium sp. ST904]|nr:hypothetical protein ADT71_24330 [Novosphingobium sp. ST904]TCM37636.1 hypothetical protein EDF59_11032 [Novosphingobium sp. ST904]
MLRLSEASPVAFVMTRDRASARVFYENVLELRVIAEDEFALAFALAGGGAMRLTSHAGHVPTQHTVLGWTVSDIRTAVGSLRGRGVEFNVYEGFGQDADGIWTAPDGTALVAWFSDPDGNILSLTEFR